MGNAVSFSSPRRWATLVALAALIQIRSAPLVAQTDAGWLTGRLDSWYHRAQRSAPGEWGIAVADQSGQLLWSRNPDLPLMPASTVKLFTHRLCPQRARRHRPARHPRHGGGVARPGHGRMDRELGARGERRSLARAGRGLGPHAVRPRAAIGGRRCAQADRTAAAPELERPPQRHLSRGLVVAAPGPDLRPAGRSAHAPREHHLGHCTARRPYRSACAGHRDGTRRDREHGQRHRQYRCAAGDRGWRFAPGPTAAGWSPEPSAIARPLGG